MVYGEICKKQLLPFVQEIWNDFRAQYISIQIKPLWVLGLIALLMWVNLVHRGMWLIILCYHSIFYKGTLFFFWREEREDTHKEHTVSRDSSQTTWVKEGPYDHWGTTLGLLHRNFSWFFVVYVDETVLTRDEKKSTEQKRLCNRKHKLKSSGNLDLLGREVATFIWSQKKDVYELLDKLRC